MNNLAASMFSTTTLLSAMMITPSAMALNIVLTNDDSWHTQNIQNLKSALESAGHDVIMSAPCTEQSGKGGAISFFKQVKVDNSKKGQQEFCVGDSNTEQSFKHYVEGTPVMAVLFGIDQAAQNIWGKAPDLVISGPNEGSNLGYLNNNSGTLGATMIALTRGIPAIAISADQVTERDNTQSKLVAKTVVNIIEQLVATQKSGEALLPAYMGLNVNTPKDINKSLGYKYTDVGWNAGNLEMLFTDDLSDESIVVDYIAQKLLTKKKVNSQEEAMKVATSMLSGKQGISFKEGNAGDNNKNSEGNAVQNGYITISTIDGNVQASRAKVSLTQQRLIGLK